jgi:hypothetical protein
MVILTSEFGVRSVLNREKHRQIPVVDWTRRAGTVTVGAMVRALHLRRREPISAHESVVDRPCPSWTIS